MDYIICISLIEFYYTIHITVNQETTVLERDVALRRYSSVRLYTAGRILHISKCKQNPKQKER